MSETVHPAVSAEGSIGPVSESLPKPPRRPRARLPLTLGVLAVIAIVGYLGVLRFKKWSAQNNDEFPVAKVEKGDVSFTIHAKGNLRGGDPETLIAPPTGGSELHLTYLAKNGEQVKSGDVIARFDTSEQEYKSKEAQADVAEAEQTLEDNRHARFRGRWRFVRYLSGKESFTGRSHRGASV